MCGDSLAQKEEEERLMYEVERVDGKTRVVNQLTGQILVELTQNSVIIVEKGESRVAVAAADASDVDLVNALIQEGRI